MRIILSIENMEMYPVWQLTGTTWGCSETCTELFLPLTGFGALESWLHLSPVAGFGRANTAPQLGSIVELVQASRAVDELTPRV